MVYISKKVEGLRSYGTRGKILWGHYDLVHYPNQDYNMRCSRELEEGGGVKNSDLEKEKRDEPAAATQMKHI